MIFFVYMSVCDELATRWPLPSPEDAEIGSNPPAIANGIRGRKGKTEKILISISKWLFHIFNSNVSLCGQYVEFMLAQVHNEVECKRNLDKSQTICKVYLTTLKYVWNATDMRNHMSRFHPELEEKLLALVAAASHWWMQDVCSKFPPNSEKVKHIIRLIGTSDIDAIENKFLCAMIDTLMPRNHLKLYVMKTKEFVVDLSCSN